MKKLKKYIRLSILSFPIAWLICIVVSPIANFIDNLLQYIFSQLGVFQLIQLNFNRDIAICCIVFSINICVLIKALEALHSGDERDNSNS